MLERGLQWCQLLRSTSAEGFVECSHLGLEPRINLGDQEPDKMVQARVQKVTKSFVFEKPPEVLDSHGCSKSAKIR